MVEVRLSAVRVDLQSNTPVLLLTETEGVGRTLPIFIGAPEATAIAFAIQGVAPPRPMTHDLLKNLIQSMNGQLDRIVITELKDDTFFAVLWLTQDGEPVTVDARPSDAIALALRADCPIYVAEPVLAVARLNPAGPPDNPSTDDLRRWLEGLNDEDLGRYKM